MRPLIGITTHFLPLEAGGRPYHQCYGRNALVIEQAGGLPVLIPSGLDMSTIRAIYDRVDAVLIPGGGDINPAQYRADHQTTLQRMDDQRDIAEINIARWALDDDLPLLGICRGNQLLNVALGGTLTQDIGSMIETDIKHDYPQPQIPYSHRAHDVKIDPNSRLAQIIGATSVTVNSLHHQCILQAAPSVAITAYAPDGIIEALEVPGKYFALSVQWHPEDMTDDDQAMQRLFTAFVQAASENALRRSHARLSPTA